MGVYNNFLIQRGTTWRQGVNWADSAGIPIDLTDYLVTLQLKNKFDSTETYEFEASVYPELGKAVFELAPTDTRSITTGYYLYEIEMHYPYYSPDENVYRILEGELYVSDEVLP